MEGTQKTAQPIERRPGDFDPKALRRLRYRAGMTVEQLAKAAGCSAGRISQLEAEHLPDKPLPPLFLRLAEALGVQPEQLEVPDRAA